MENKYKPGIIIMLSLFGIAVIASFFIIVSGTKTVKSDGGDKSVKNVFSQGANISPNSIAVLNIFSPIQYVSDGGAFNIKKSGTLYWLELLDKVEKNSSIKALIIRINSPGGTIAATQEIYNKIHRIRKKGKIVVVSMGDICASGGYYIASAADYIVANPGTVTGSIGVIMGGLDLSGLFTKYGIGYNVIKSGKNKDIMSPFRKMSKEERAMLEELVMDAYYQFFNAVAESRNIDKKKLKKVADGRILSANQAKAANLIDELGDFEDTITITAEKAGIKGTPNVFELKPDMKKMFEMFTAKALGQKPEVNLIKTPSILADNYSPIMYMYTY